MDAFDDVLRGGFGVHEYDEPIRLIWLNSNKSREDLGWKETVKYVKTKLKTCHPSNIESVKKDLACAERHEGKTLFEIIVGIIQRHEHIELTLE